MTAPYQQPESPPPWLRLALLAYFAVMLITVLYQGVRFFSHSVMMAGAGPRKSEIVDLVRETAGINEAAAKDLVDSLSTGDGERERPPTAAVEKKGEVQVAQAWSAEAANGIKARFAEKGASVDVRQLSYGHLPYLLWAVMNLAAGGMMLAAVWFWKPRGQEQSYLPPPLKLALLVVGGVLGLSTFIALGVYPVVAPLFGLYSPGEWHQAVKKGRAAWKSWPAWQPLVLAYGGLMVIFLSVLAVRSEERANAGIRRLIYGYNSALNGLLLLGILIVANVIVNSYGVDHGQPFGDWTQGHVYSISDGSRDSIKNLKQTVTFYIIFSPDEPSYADIKKLLENFKNANPEKVQVEELDPMSFDRREQALLKALNQQFPWPATDPSEPGGIARGVLIVAESADQKADFEFLKRFPDLFDRGEGGGRVFKGEQAVMSAVLGMTANRQVVVVLDDPGQRKADVARAIRDATGLGQKEAEELIENAPSTIKEHIPRDQAREIQKKLQDAGAVVSVGARQTIYITQGHGEPALTESKISLEPHANFGLGLLKQRLEENGYTVKPLSLRPLRLGAPIRVPRDASVVIVAGPSALDAPAIEALREYMKDRKNRMIVLAEPNVTESYEILPTNLEPFLAEFGVDARTDVVINAQAPFEVPDLADIRLSPGRDLALVAPFQRVENSPLQMIRVRSVRSKTAEGMEPSRFRVAPLFETAMPRQQGLPLLQWTETDLPQFMRALETNPEPLINQRVNRNKQEKTPPFPVALTVRRPRAEGGFDPHSPTAEGDPCMVVIGDVTLATNMMMVQPAQGRRFVPSDRYYNLLTGCIAWLRDKPEQITAIQPQTRSDYKLKPETAEKIDEIRWYPGVLLVAIIVIAGAGVLLMRRR